MHKQVVDYTAHEPVEDFLADRFGGDQNFDFIVDCAGSQTLFTRCPPYLKPSGRFISIVGGKSQGVYAFLMNEVRPVLLGGTPRGFKILAVAPAGHLAQQAAKWVEDGIIKEALVDSEFALEDVVQVSSSLMISGEVSWLTTAVSRHMSGSKAGERRAKSSSRLEHDAPQWLAFQVVPNTHGYALLFFSFLALQAIPLPTSLVVLICFSLHFCSKTGFPLPEFQCMVISVADWTGPRRRIVYIGRGRQNPYRHRTGIPHNSPGLDAEPAVADCQLSVTFPLPVSWSCSPTSSMQLRRERRVTPVQPHDHERSRDSTKHQQKPGSTAVVPTQCGPGANGTDGGWG